MTSTSQLLRDAEMRLECVLSCLTFRVEDPQAIQLARNSLLRALAAVRAAQDKIETARRRSGDGGESIVLEPGHPALRR